ncbi:MAG TPA: hypothetical protein VK425_10045, partial [Acidimicrobiales bacterium]|nr:hypothetical protein [Acidimicrobiales bacterium]
MSQVPPRAGGEPAERPPAGANEEMMAVARFRLRATFAKRWPEYAALVMLIGVLGGIAMGSVIAGRRTQASYPSFLASTNASDLTLSTYGIGNAGATNYSPRVAEAISRLPEVKRVESWVGVFAVPLLPNGAPNLALADNDINFAASKDGLYFDIDRVTPIEGRVADPRRADEFMTTALGARLMGAHLGQVVPIGAYLPQQANLPGFGTARVPPWLRLDMKLVGIVEFNNEVVQDDTDRLPTNVVYTPAFTRLLPISATEGTWYGIQLVHPHEDIATVERALLRLLPPGAAGFFSVTAITEAKVERALKPESIALAVFGLIAALAALGTALPVVARQLRSTEEDRGALRALGAGPMTTFLDGFVGTFAAIVAGSALAGFVALALSALAPLGPVRRVYHPASIDFDWVVLGSGFVLLIGGIGSAAGVLGWRSSPHRIARRSYFSRPSRLAQLAAAVGLPLPGVVGLQLALGPGQGRTAVPARSVLAGAVIAVITVTATLTFSASLHTLVTHP